MPIPSARPTWHVLTCCPHAERWSLSWCYQQVAYLLWHWKRGRYTKGVWPKACRKCWSPVNIEAIEVHSLPVKSMLETRELCVLYYKYCLLIFIRQSTLTRADQERIKKERKVTCHENSLLILLSKVIYFWFSLVIGVIVQIFGGLLDLVEHGRLSTKSSILDPSVIQPVTLSAAKNVY